MTKILTLYVVLKVVEQVAVDPSVLTSANCCDGTGTSNQDQMAFICNIIIEMGLNDQNTDYVVLKVVELVAK